MTAPIYSIAERAPEFAPMCWLKSAETGLWERWSEGTFGLLSIPERNKYSHWSPDAPHAPTATPPTLGGDDNAPTAVLSRTSSGEDPPVIPSDPASRAAPLPADGEAAAQEATLNLIQFGVLKNADFECAKQNVKRAYAPLLERHARELAEAKRDARAYQVSAKDYQMDKLYDKANADLAQLRAERDALLADRERLDWLEKRENGRFQDNKKTFTAYFGIQTVMMHTLREAIDLARRADAPNKQPH